MWKKLIAPIVVTVLVLVWLGVYLAMAAGLLRVPDAPLALKAVFVLVPLCLGGVAVYNLVERIHEIRSGEEDDLDNY